MPKLGKLFIKNTLTLLFLVNGTFAFADFDSNQNSNNNALFLYQQINTLGYQNPDSSAHALELLYKASLKNSDTLQAINSLRELAHVYSHQGNHKLSYDHLWSALMLADASNTELGKSLVYKDIGRHYSYYNRREEALKFLNLSLESRKKMINKGTDKGVLVDGYLAFAATFREMNEWNLNKIYLDSCQLYLSYLEPTSTSRYFYKFEEAVSVNNLKNHEEALTKFKEIAPWFKEHYPTYQVLLFTYLGDSYRDLGRFTESENYYNKALVVSETRGSHMDFTPLIYERLSDLYFSKNKHIEAYNSIKKAKELDALYFDSRSENNSPLLEIQDAFLKEKKLQEDLAKEQRLNQMEQDEKVLFLQKTILSTFIIILILFGLIYFNNVRSKHRAEKQVIKEKRELEVQKNTEIIELKNKELAASVLKLIEKDAFIETLKNKLSNGKGDINRHEAKQIIHSISSNNVENWNEFEARFVAINKSFYQNLKEEHPNLTLNDQRLCALVKLNFSSKDIARLLNMSPDSVHTTRSRLRKKLELPRNMNLKQFIANI
ncbi:tetratricopeptide repeat protein [Seonamhaeicola maritimus]|uniref:Tetratricopeptide repeat protein n=1 Tax=Seonamhaeicola maritimus TaxID=2591822 RepID=A0A5C7GDN7_9FLAO|nr:tetratricopeptide repeat protein [Seonamhaeicola maritimus]TXG34678.1 tetratricopeptide repeat protein [Seonamhaeicola maritimus]